MVTLTLQLNDSVASWLNELAAEQQRSAEDLGVDAVTQLAEQKPRVLPKGIGAYRSRQSDGLFRAREILHEAARSGRWP